MKKIVVSGYFDPIHVGHIEYINNAKKLRLVIVYNNNPMCSKKRKIFYGWRTGFNFKNIKAVDEVFLSIDEDKQFANIEKVNPDVFANGGIETMKSQNQKFVKKIIFKLLMVWG